MEVAVNPAQEEDVTLRQAVDETIADHDGNLREAIKALLEKIAFLQAARDRALDLVSRSYARGRIE